MKTKKLTRMALMLALALIIGAVERRIVIVPGVPGIKPGLGNVVILFTLAVYGRRDAALMTALRTVLGGLLFGGITGMMYSAAGGILALAAMSLLVDRKGLSLTGVSVAGACAHIAGQLAMSRILLMSWAALVESPFLILSAVVTGIMNGIITTLLIKAASRFDR